MMTAETIQVPGYVAGKWALDPVHSQVGFTVKHMMVSKVRGHFKIFDAEIITADDPLKSSFTARVDLRSVDTGQEQRDNHIRSADFFEVETHPEMTYRSTGIRLAADGEGFIVDGELTIRGVTRQVPFQLEVEGFGPDPFGGTRSGFSLTGEINRSDFGVSFNGPIPGTSGGVVVSEKVQIQVEIEAVLEKEDQEG
jgi:polyisoprenoid-binding protein YceI